METRKLALIIVSGLNSLVEEIEKLANEDDDGDGKEGKGSGSSRSSARSKTSSKNSSRKGRDDDDKDDDADGDGDAPSEDDVIDAVRGAQKVLESADIKKILKKHGKADRASEVEEEHRQAVIDALEKAVEAAE